MSKNVAKSNAKIKCFCLLGRIEDELDSTVHRWWFSAHRYGDGITGTPKRIGSKGIIEATRRPTYRDYRDGTIDDSMRLRGQSPAKNSRYTN